VEAGRVAGVETTRGSIAAPAVVNAAGPWARRVGALAGVDLPIAPLRRHIFLAEPSGGGSWDDCPGTARVPGTRVMVIDFETSFYFHREGGRLLFGMGDPDETPGFDTSVRWDFLPNVIEVALRRLPALADGSVSHAWAGLYEMTPDGMPIIGLCPEVGGFYTIAGFSGHGFQHSPAAGRVLADLLVRRDPGLDLTPFASGRFAAADRAGEACVV
jgi:sarcosine oxidase subunit beta